MNGFIFGVLPGRFTGSNVFWYAVARGVAQRFLASMLPQLWSSGTYFAAYNTGTASGPVWGGWGAGD
jgi:hypothetical protein